MPTDSLVLCACQVLEGLEILDTSVLEPFVLHKVAAFWAAASRIRDRLLTYHCQKKYTALPGTYTRRAQKKPPRCLVPPVPSAH